MPVNKPAQREHARYLYFTTALTYKQIADATEVNHKTIARWVQEGNWEESKRGQYYSPDQETHNLYEELREIDNNIRSREEGKRYGTNEELDSKTRILNLIMGPLKNTTDKWRNITPQYEVEDTSDMEGEFKPRGFNIIIDGIDPRDEPDL